MNPEDYEKWKKIEAKINECNEKISVLVKERDKLQEKIQLEKITA